MAGVNISNVGLAFTRYLDGVIESLNQESKARTLVKQEDRWTGDHIETRLHTARNHAVRYTEDGGAFPTADKEDYVPVKSYRKFAVGSIQLTDGVMAAAAGNKNVARDVITSEVKGMMNNILKFENGMFFRDGTGAVAQFVETDPSSQTVTEVDDARMLWDGATYDVYDNSNLSSAPTLHGTGTVTSTSASLTASGNPSVTFDAALPAGLAHGASGDYLVWSGSVNRAISGLDLLIDDAASTFQNVNCSTYPRYTSHVLDNSGTNRDLTPNLFRQMLAGIRQKSGNERPAQGITCLTNSWQSINVEELYEGELRLTPETKTAGLAVAAFQTALGRVEVVTDSDALYNKMFFCDFSKIYRSVQKKLSWRRQGGSIFKRSDTAGIWTATAIEIAELYIKERHTSGKIEDLTESKTTPY